LAAGGSRYVVIVPPMNNDVTVPVMRNRVMVPADPADALVGD
jgi:hypothetical protein